jgi:predicted nuclease of predicted toxin-antitoxin system
VVILNVAIYVDYDNLFKRLKALGYHPIHDLDFFSELKAKFTQDNHDIVKYMAFADFMGNGLNIKDQTEIHTFGLDVLHCNVSNKNTTDSEFMLAATKDLYEMDNIDVFVLVSNDRDYVPLMRLIKEKSKKVYVLTTEKATNKVVNVFADYHQYIEDLFNLKEESKVIQLPEKKEDLGEISDEDQGIAGEVSKRFYESEAYSKLKEGKKVSLDGYAQNLSRVRSLKLSKSKIKGYFIIAHELKFINIVESNGIMYIEEGELFQEILGKSVAASKGK